MQEQRSRLKNDVCQYLYMDMYSCRYERSAPVYLDMLSPRID